MTAGSFSKTAAPGYRTGWLLPGRFTDQVLKLKRALSFSSGLLQQLTLAEFMEMVRRILAFELLQISGASVTVSTLLASLLVAVVALVMAKLAEKAIGRAFRRKGVYEQGSIAVAGRLLYYAVAAIGMVIALDTLGLQLSALFAAGAVFAVGLGFGLQNMVQNFVSGIILLGERTIKPNDVLEVDGRLVRVTHMGLRATIARTLDEEEPAAKRAPALAPRTAG